MSEKGLIPKISPSNFRYDNWDAAAPLKFSESYYTDFLDSVVGVRLPVFCADQRMIMRI